MKPFTLSIILTCSLLMNISAMAQEEKPTSNALLELQQAFTNLPPEKREEFAKETYKIKTFMKQKRYIDALEKTFQLDKIFPDHPSTLSNRAACYVELRAFDKARALYKKLSLILSEDIGTQFNLGELYFVSKDWQQAHDAFDKLVQKGKTELVAFYEIALFKLIIAKVNLGDLDEAQKLAADYTKWDDTPLYYYAKAVFEYHDGDKLASNKTLQECYFAWGQSPDLIAWQDTMMESGYLSSLYNTDNKTSEQELP